jgi:hypothetical protein
VIAKKTDDMEEVDIMEPIYLTLLIMGVYVIGVIVGFNLRRK